MDYIKEGRKKSNAELDQKANEFMSEFKKGLNNGE